MASPSKNDPPWKRTPAQNLAARSKKEAQRKRGESHRRMKLVNFEPDAPVCRNCSHFQKPGTRLADSIPRKVSARCLLNKFPLKSDSGSCDVWVGTDGSTLLEST
jgi:hypothetical protein